MASETKILAWHFVGDTLRDGRPVPEDGEVLRHDGPMEMYASGLHASVRCVDALQYAPGDTLCRVECSGDVEHGGDKFICRERVILSRINSEPLLRAWARWCALQVINLWDAPSVVVEYLTTGDESQRNAAWDAARAALGASQAAAWCASQAALAAVWGAGVDAARAAGIDAARAALTAAPAWGAARDEAWGAARDAAWNAALDAQSAQLERMAEEAMAGKTEWMFDVPEVMLNAQIDDLRAEIEKWRAVARAQEDLLAAYRLGDHRMTGRILSALERARAALSRLDAEEDPR